MKSIAKPGRILLLKFWFMMKEIFYFPDPKLRIHVEVRRLIVKAGHAAMALQVAKVMYVMPPAAEAPIKVSAPMKAVLYACMAAILILGLFQRDLYEAALAASRALF